MREGTTVVAWLEGLSKDDVGLAGGKGANLGELLRADLPVPPGFVVTSEAFLQTIEEAGSARSCWPGSPRRRSTTSVNAADRLATTPVMSANTATSPRTTSARQAILVGAQASTTTSAVCGSSRYPTIPATGTGRPAAPDPAPTAAAAGQGRTQPQAAAARRPAGR